MVQVTGNLKVRTADSGSDGDGQKVVIGFVGECRLIESTASILEISIPQSYFTTTISMDMKIVSVESQLVPPSLPPSLPLTSSSVLTAG